MVLRGKVKKLILKSRESALLAVSIYNNPQTVFKTYSYIINMCIAWTSLFHAIFEKNNIKYFYLKNQKKMEYEKIDGEYKAWDLSTCCQKYFKGATNAVKANIEILIKLRNKIEHRFLPELDSHVFGECQSCLFNYEKMLINEFGLEHGINSSLAFSIQFSEVYEDSQIKSMKSMKMKELENIKKYMDEYRMEYSDEILESMEYSFRVFLIPQIGNNINSADRSIEFIKKSDLTEEQYEILKKDIALIKNKRVSVSNDDKMSPGMVVKLVNSKVDFEFKIHHHTYCWKYYKVRPKTKSDNPEETDSKYCNYDSVHNDYVYTKQWVNKLVKDLSNEKIRKKIFESRGQF